MKNNVRKRIIVITGCDSGIGKGLVEELAKRGYTIVQSYLEINNFENHQDIYSIKLDLRIEKDIEEFCKFLKDLLEQGNKLEGLIANAGVALGGPIENMPIKIFRETYEVNFFGVIKVIQCLIPELIRDKGKIMVHGSMAGKVAVPFLSPYASSKFALEGFVDSLRREMLPFGVKTILLETAAVATPIWNKYQKQDISFVQEKYMKSLIEFRDKFIQGGNKGMAIAKAANMIADIFEKKQPKARYIVASNRLTSKMLTMIPNSLLDKILLKLFKMDYGDK